MRSPIPISSLSFAALGSALLWGCSALSATPASAACVQTGASVDCSGNDFNGFLTPQTVTLHVQPGGFINNIITNFRIGNCPLSYPAIEVGASSNVLNEGYISTSGVCGFGIVAARGSSITNHGTVLTGDLVSYAIIADDNGFVRNAGTITTARDSSSGILGGSGMRIVSDTGSTIRTSGSGSSGFEVRANSVIIHDGRITVSGDASYGIDAGLDSSVTNTGIIETSSNNSIGIRVAGGDVTNSGTIRTVLAGPAFALTPTAGVSVIGPTASFTNTSTASVIATHIGVRIGGTLNASLSNSGAIEAATAIQYDGTPSINGGAIVVTGTAAIEIGNAGTISGREGLPALRSLGPAVTLRNSGAVRGDVLLAGGNDTVFLSGTIDGAVDFGGGNDTLVLQRGGRFEVPIANLENLSKSGSDVLVLGRNLAVSDHVVIIGGGLEIPRGVQLTARLTDNAANVRGLGTLVGGLDNSSIVAPGTQAEKGTLTVTGAFRQFASGTLAIRLSPDGTSDKLVVGGPAAFAGTLALTYDAAPGAASFRDGQRFDIVTPLATSLTSSGQFTLTAPQLTFVDANLVTTSNGGLAVEFDRLSYSAAAASESQVSVAEMLDRQQQVRPAALAGTFERLEASSLENATTILADLAPETPAALQDLNLMSLERFDESLRGRTPRTNSRGNFVWSRGFTSSGHTRDVERRRDYDFRGLAAGIETPLGDARIGIAAARIGSEIGGGRDGVNFDTSLFALTAHYDWTDVGIDAALAYGSSSPDVRRVRSSGGTTEALSSQAETDLWSVSLDAVYRTAVGPVGLAPYVGGSYHRAKLGGLNEGQPLGVVTAEVSTESLRARLGARVSAAVGRIRPYGDLSLSRELLHARSEVPAALIGVPNSAFTLYGETRRRTAIESEAGVAFAISEGLEAYVAGAMTANDVLAGRRLMAGFTFSW